MRVYLYGKRKRKAGLGHVNRLKPMAEGGDEPPLTGLVHGKRATDIEERFARGLDQAGLAFAFQVEVYVLGSLPGRGKVVDFVVRAGMLYPVEVDGPIGHSTAAELGADAVRTAFLNERFRKMGWALLERAPWWQLQNQAQADRTVRRVFGGPNFGGRKE